MEEEGLVCQLLGRAQPAWRMETNWRARRMQPSRTRKMLPSVCEDAVMETAPASPPNLFLADLRLMEEEAAAAAAAAPDEEGAGDEKEEEEAAAAVASSSSMSVCLLMRRLVVDAIKLRRLRLLRLKWRSVVTCEWSSASSVLPPHLLLACCTTAVARAGLSSAHRSATFSSTLDPVMRREDKRETNKQRQRGVMSS